MAWSERFVVGRVRKRMLRAPAVDGWLADELDQVPLEQVSIALGKADGELTISPPGSADLIKLGPIASDLVAAGDCELMVGWPERIVIVRIGRQVQYADGDVVHFGPLALDRETSVERTGYQYLAETGAEVRVELAIHHGGDEQRELLDPGQSVRAGSYQITHEHSFDPSDRPGGARHHGYSFVVRRTAAPAPIATDVPHPLEITDAAPVIAVARSRGLLGDGEALLGEADVLSALLDRYEGPRHKLEDELRQLGPAAAFRRRGERVEVESPHLARGDSGAACYGRARVSLDPTGGVSVSRDDLGTMPGRLRKPH